MLNYNFLEEELINNPAFSILFAENHEDLQKWLELWNSWPKREVFAHPEYLNLFTDSDNQACCAVLESDKGFVLYSFILRDLQKEIYSINASNTSGTISDIISPYGYGGPFTWDYKNQEELSQIFWRFFDKWALDNNIVSEVLKFSLFPQDVLIYPYQKELKLKNVVIDLELSEEQLWSNFDSKVRRNIKKAKSNDIRIIFSNNDNSLENFIEIYNMTMARRQAEQKYFFSRDFFVKITEKLAGQFIFAYAVYKDKIISVELVLISSDKIYFFLGGTDSNFFNLRPNDLLKYEIILWAKKNNKKQYILGGGYQEDDGIFKYKKSFAPGNIVPFYVGSRIIRQDLYEKLVENKKAKMAEKGIQWLPEKEMIPAYRF